METDRIESEPSSTFNMIATAFEAAKANGNVLALIAALALVLRTALAKKPSMLIRDLGKVGRLEDEAESSSSEFDIIIAGGGRCHICMVLCYC